MHLLYHEYMYVKAVISKLMYLITQATYNSLFTQL